MSPREFRATLIISWVVIVAGIAVGVTTERYLPQPLLAYLEAESEAPVDPGTAVTLTLAAGVLVLALAVTIGLFRLRPWARKLLVPSILVSLGMTALMGPYVQTGISAVFDYAATLLEGAIVALAYFSPVATAFGKATMSN